MYIDVDTHYWPLKSDERVKHPGRGYVEIEGGNGTYYRDGKVALADESLYPFYEECARLDIPLLVHPAPFLFADGVPHPALTGAQMLPKGSGFPLGLGLPFTYMSTIGDLIFGGLMERFPTL